MNLGTRMALAAIFVAAVHAAQKLPAPKFEVVSIRALPPNPPPPVLRPPNFTPILPGGQYIDSRASLLSMIAAAFNLRNPDAQVVGLPASAKSQTYAVAARPARGFPFLFPAENEEQVRLMLRAMLAERFRLQMHSEMRRQPVLGLLPAKGGILINESGPPTPPEKEGAVNAAVSERSGLVIAQKATMAGLANALTVLLKQPVIDKTGLKGYYDFDVRWKAPETAVRQPPRPGSGDEGRALLISNLQDKLGVRLVKTVGPVEYWIVDHVEPPASN